MTKKTAREDHLQQLTHFTFKGDHASRKLNLNDCLQYEDHMMNIECAENLSEEEDRGIAYTNQINDLYTTKDRNCRTIFKQKCKEIEDSDGVYSPQGLELCNTLLKDLNDIKEEYDQVRLGLTDL